MLTSKADEDWSIGYMLLRWVLCRANYGGVTCDFICLIRSATRSSEFRLLMSSIADGVVRDEYKESGQYKGIFIQMMERQEGFVMTWVLKPIYCFIGKERLMVYRLITMSRSVEGLEPIYVNILWCWDFFLDGQDAGWGRCSEYYHMTYVGVFDIEFMIW